jgi:hypothetical protein
MVTITVDGEAAARMGRRDFVLLYLSQKPEEYVYALYNAWREYAEQVGKPPGDYASFRSNIYRMKKIEGTIIVSRIEESRNKWAKIYYKLAA